MQHGQNVQVCVCLIHVNISLMIIKLVEWFITEMVEITYALVHYNPQSLKYQPRTQVFLQNHKH